MNNMKSLGMISGLIGGGICVFGGLICLLTGMATLNDRGSAIPPGLYFAMGFYFVGKGVFVAGISLNVAYPTSVKEQEAIDNKT